MSRPARITAVVFGLFVFLGISALVARALAGTGNERAAVLELVRAQARGDADGVLDRLPVCRAEPACVRVVRRRVAELRRPGHVQVLRYDPSMQMAITRRRGVARVAWRTDRTTMPVVQCVKVQREGPLTGGRADLITISAPIEPTGSCG